MNICKYCGATFRPSRKNHQIMCFDKVCRQKYKNEWQQKKRDEFTKRHGYSQNLYYRFSGQREAALQRDRYRCVECGMTDFEHKKKWNRPITVDHMDKDEENNDLDNLQTLCLTCHGRKDLIKRLRVQRVPKFKKEIMQMRNDGYSYQNIADRFGFTPAGIFKWVKRWEEEEHGDE